MADDIMKIVGGFIAIVIIISFMGVLSSMFISLGKQQCQPYIDTISSKDSIITSLNGTIIELNNQLTICKNNYDQLIKQNITKKDIEEIKGYYNLTQIQYNTLTQMFQQTNQKYDTFYSTVINNYRISIIINITILVTLLSIEIVSMTMLKSEFIMFVIESFKKKRESHKKSDLPALD